MDIQPYLKLMVEKNASDLFFTCDSPVKIKLEGKAAKEKDALDGLEHLSLEETEEEAGHIGRGH